MGYGYDPVADPPPKGEQVTYELWKLRRRLERTNALLGAFLLLATTWTVVGLVVIVQFLRTLG